MATQKPKTVVVRAHRIVNYLETIHELPVVVPTRVLQVTFGRGGAWIIAEHDAPPLGRPNEVPAVISRLLVLLVNQESKVTLWPGTRFVNVIEDGRIAYATEAVEVQP